MRKFGRKRVNILIILLILIFLSCSHKEERIKNARKFIKKWNYDRALTEIIAYRGKADAEIQYLLGYCYLKKNEFGEAATYFEKTLAISETFKDSIIKVYNRLAQNALRIHEPERTLFLYHEIAKLVPDYEQANNLFLVGDLNFEKGNYPAALEAYVKAYEIDSTSARAKKTKHNLIEVLKECDSVDLALELATKEYENLKTAANLLQLSEIRFKLGIRLFDKGLHDSAQVFFRQITDHQDPKSLLDDAYFYLGEIYLKQEDFSAALDAYKRVLRLNPYEKGEIIQVTKERIKEIKEKI